MMNIYQQERSVFIETPDSLQKPHRISDMLLTWTANDIVVGNPPAGADLLGPGDSMLYSVGDGENDTYVMTFIGRHPDQNIYYSKTIVGDNNTSGSLRYTVSGGNIYDVVTSAEQPIDGQTGVWIKSGTTVISSAMRMSNVTVASGQSQYVYSYGVVTGGSVLYGAKQYVSSGGVASVCEINNGSQLIIKGTAMSCTLSGASQILTGGYAAYTSGNGDVTMSAGTAASAAYLNVTYVYVGYGCILSSSVVGRITLAGGGNAQASACDVTVESGIVIYGGAMYLSNFTIERLNNPTSMNNNNNRVFNLSLTSGVINNCRGVFQGYSISAGAMTMSTGTFTDGIVHSGGALTAFSGANLSGVTVSSDGSLTVSSGGTALAVTSNAGAVVVVEDGGYIEYA